MRHCTQCECPLDCSTSPNVIGPFALCCVCFEMWLAVAGNPWFIKAQQELIDEIQHKKQLLNGD